MRRTLARSRALLLLLVAAIVLSPVLVVTSAEAAAYQVRITLSDTNVVVGDMVHVHGTVKPATSGKVLLQRRKSGTWTTFRRLRLDTGVYTTTVRFDEPGVAYLRVVAPGGNGASRGVSKTRTVRVLNHATNPQIVTASLPSGSVGTPYDAQVKNADDRPGTWSIAQGSLPPGLTLDPATGKISGTPTAVITSDFAVYFRDQDGRVAARMYKIQVVDTAPEQLIVTTALPNGVKGTAYSAQLKSKDDRAGTWSVTQGALPAGLTVNGTTGAITGTPTAVGKADFTVRFQDSADHSSARVLSITVGETQSAPVIATSSLPPGVVGDPYAVQMHTADGRTGTWSITQGTLPPGLALTASTGVISGTPTTTAIKDFTVRFQDGAGQAVTKEFSIVVEASRPEIITTSLPAAVKDEAYSTALKTKDDRPGVWNVSQGTLPAGLALNQSTGVITGTPTAVGSSTFQIRFRDTLGVTDSQELTIVVAASRPVIATTTLPKGTKGKAYTATLKTADNRAGTWAVQSGALPAGLTLNATTGVISGTPTTNGKASFVIRFRDAAGVEATKPLTIQIGSCLLLICV